MARNASIVHHLPGRMRLRIPSAKADTGFLEQAGAALAALPGVTDVTCNALTGSVLISYSPQRRQELEGALISGDGILPFVLRDTPGHPSRTRGGNSRESVQTSEFARAILETAAEFDDAVRKATGNAVDVKTLVPLIAAAAGVSLIGGSTRTPIWLTLLMFAFSSFVSLHAAGTANADAASRKPASA